jgi:hypothetical protein
VPALVTFWAQRCGTANKKRMKHNQLLIFSRLVL